VTVRARPRYALLLGAGCLLVFLQLLMFVSSILLMRLRSVNHLVVSFWSGTKVPVDRKKMKRSKELITL